MASSDVLAPGSVFAESFRIAELLGEGEMGVAYVVDELPSGTRCVLKVMDAFLVRQPELRERFAADAKATSRVASPHVLQTRDAGIDRTSGRAWFTAEWLRGEDLATRVGRWGSQRPADVLALVLALGDALGKAHAQGMVHYDLTPENIHLVAGKPFGVVLRELTLSRLVSDACAAEGDVIGSAMWMPPEQFDLGQTLAPAANVWSLGLLAFYAATGHAYWLAASSDPSPSRELLREILVEPLAPSSVRARALGCTTPLPPWFDEWFTRCVNRDPSRRFAEGLAARAFLAAQVQERPHEPVEAPADDQRTTRRLPPPPARVKGSRSLPRGILADARGEALPAKPAPPLRGAAGAALPAVPQTTAKRRGRTWPYVVMLALGAAFLAWFESERPTREPQASSAAVPSTSDKPRPSAPSALPVGSSSSETAVAARDSVDASPLAAAPDAAPARGGSGAATVAFALRDAPVGSGSAEYDLAEALRAVNRIYYGACAVPSAGKLAITFAPSGRVKQVAVLRGDYDEETTACVAARFGTARTTPFQGGPQTVTAELAATTH
jgi:serine/threonine protein kinase